jgi:hypothetical protein
MVSVSVGGGWPDSDDCEATIGIQVRAFNELQLQDLRKKTFGATAERRGHGGEATFGYRSVRNDAAGQEGRPRPDATGRSSTREAAAPASSTRLPTVALESSIVRELNGEGVAGRRKSSCGWSPATVHRVATRAYAGR